LPNEYKWDLGFAGGRLFYSFAFLIGGGLISMFLETRIGVLALLIYYYKLAANFFSFQV